jgi:hypothetical protein
MLLPCEEPAAALLFIAVSGVDSACVIHLRHLRGPAILQHAWNEQRPSLRGWSGCGCCILPGVGFVDTVEAVLLVQTMRACQTPNDKSRSVS